MKTFAKPTYIDEQFLEVTKHGWVDKRTGEVLVAIAGLDAKIKAELEKYTETTDEIIHLPVIIKEDSIDDDIEKIVNEDVPVKEEVKEEVKETATTEVQTPKRRGRRPKAQATE